MSLWHRLPPVTADVGNGFVATEAPAMQRAIAMALLNSEVKKLPLVVELQFSAGAGERVVVGCRNVYVGFVPVSHLADLRGQLLAAGKAPLRAPGMVYPDGKFRRVWVGAPPADGFPAVEAGYDELPEPTPAIFGIPINRLRRDR